MTGIFSKLGWAIGAVTVIGSGVYFFLYLARWEWHRGLIAGVVLVAAEVALATAMIIRAIHGKSTTPEPGIERLPMQKLAASVPRDPHDFKWLGPGDRYGVFIPVLLSGGVIMSAVGWVVEKVAGGASGGSRQEADLQAIGLPEGGLVPSTAEARASKMNHHDDQALRRLLGPYAAGEGS